MALLVLIQFILGLCFVIGHAKSSVTGGGSLPASETSYEIGYGEIFKSFQTLYPGSLMWHSPLVSYSGHGAWS